MISVGRMNRLQVVERTPFGLQLGDGGERTVLLPQRHVPEGRDLSPGDVLEVFVHHDSEDRLVATTETPKAQVGQFASLKVVDKNRVGLFLDWGLAKDLLLPHSEELKPLAVGDYAVVYVFLDDRRGRITASARIERYLDKEPARYRTGDEVDLLPVSGTDLGVKAIINHLHWGLLHHSELNRFLPMGKPFRGYIKEVRPDGKISLSLDPVGQKAVMGLAEQVLAKLEEEGGVLMLSDKSSPELIQRVFKTSKGSFKKAIGTLYKQGKIIIHADRIERAS